MPAHAAAPELLLCPWQDRNVTSPSLCSGETEARCGEEREQEQLSGRSSCYPGHPEAGRAAGPEEQVAERRALWS